MTSKERVRMALEHQEADRVPLDIGGTGCTSMHRLVENELKEKLNLEDHGTQIRLRESGCTIVDSSIQDYFGADCCLIHLNETGPWIDNGGGTFTDQWKLRRRLDPNGHFYEAISHPLAEAETVEDIEKFELFPFTEYMVEGLKDRIEQHKDKWLILDGFREQMFGVPCWLRDNCNFLMDLIAEEDMAEALLDKLLAHQIAWVDFVYDHIGATIDMVKMADDLGTQQSLMISPETYRKMIKPRQAALIAHIKEKFGCKIFLHSCGAVRPLIDDFIEIGVDALNPVQISARGMEPEGLKKDFGDRITFWGGGVDTQHILQQATPKEVAAEVKKNLLTFKPGGGYVFAQVHNLVPGVPFENIKAMYDTFHEYAGY